MNSDISDEFLYRHIPRAEFAATEAIPAENELQHTFSGRFLRKMRELLKYERRGMLGRFSMQLGRIAAALVAVVLLMNMMLYVSVEAYREKYYEIIRTATEKFTSIFVEVEDDAPVTELVPIDPPYIPEGFVIVEQLCNEAINNIVYSNNNGREIFYSQMVAGSGISYFDTEGAEVENNIVESREVFVITENEMIQVYWTDGSYEFVIISNAEYDQIMDVVEKIIKKLK